MIIKGIDESKIRDISKFKGESLDILDYRLRCYNLFKNMSLPSFGPKIDINFDDIAYYEMNDDVLTDDWNNINVDVKNEFDSLGVLESENHLDGIGVQYQSEVIYHNMLKELEEKNVIFTSIEEAFRKYPKLV